MTEQRHPVEGFRPGEYLQDELDARGWTTALLSLRSGLTIAGIEAIISGDAKVNTVSAKALAKAFGTSHEMWLNLNNQYEAWLMREAANTRQKGLT